MARALAIGLSLLLTGCAAASPTASLEGRVWDGTAQRFVTVEEAEARVAAADYALLGETHDNPAHHEIQARLLATIARTASPAVVFEQVDRERQAALDAGRAAPGANAPSVMDAGHVGPAWPARFYAPLFQLALDRSLPIVAANYSRTEARELVTRGLASIPPEEARRLALAEAWTPERTAKQRALLVEGHCGQDDPIIDKLVDVQRVRDAVMADAILEWPRSVAIIGRGHARKDLGVPLYLAARAPQRRVISVGIVEVEDGHGQPEDYDEARAGVHDLVWFTARAARADPCASFKPIRR